MFRKTPKQFIYIAIFVVPFLLLFFNSSFGHGLKLKLMGFGTLSVAMARWPVKEVQMIFSYRKSFCENQKLKKDMSTLKARVISLEEMVREEGRYERLARFREKQSFSSVSAVVVARDPANWNSSLMVNKGKSDGIKPGMAVINGDGVVGKVAEVAQHVSKVVLVNDSGFSVAVIDRRSRESALLTGSLSGRCRMSYLPERADIETGDEIITSKLSADFPEGVLVGTVIRVFPADNDSSMEVVVDPAITVSQLEEVLIIK